MPQQLSRLISQPFWRNRKPQVRRGGWPRRCAIRFWRGASASARISFSTRPPFSVSNARRRCRPPRQSNASIATRWCTTICRRWTTTNCGAASRRCGRLMTSGRRSSPAMRCRLSPSSSSVARNAMRIRVCARRSSNRLQRLQARSGWLVAKCSISRREICRRTPHRRSPASRDCNR